MLEKLQKLQNAKEPTNPAQKNWYTDRHQAVQIQRNVLALLSLMAIIFSAIAIFAVYRNIPIVTVEPFVIQVEPKTGITQVVRSVTAKSLTAQEAVNTFFIVRFVKAYESFNPAIRQNYQIVRLSSDPSNVFRPYAWSVNPNNPEGFGARSGGVGKREVRIKSMTRLDKNDSCIEKVCAMQIRVRIVEEIRNQAMEYNKVILMEYTYTTLNLTVEERYVNPIGFRVLSYQLDDEVLQ